MNAHTSINWLTTLLLCLWPLPTAFGQAEVTPNKISGILRWNNAAPALLDLLNPPANNGMSRQYVLAYSVEPVARTANSDYIPTESLTGTHYELSVDSDPAGIPYLMYPRVSMLDQVETYYFTPRTSPPVVAGAPGVTMDFEECLGALTVRFVDSAGLPVAVDGGNINALDVAANADMAYLDPIAPGATEQLFFVRGDTETKLTLTLWRGQSSFVDRIRFTVVTNVTVPCDKIGSVNVVVPTASELSEITGTVDMLGEFELTIDGYDAGDAADLTSVVARYGPFGNYRYAAVPGVHFTQPASGDFRLSNVLPTTLDPASVGYLLDAEMYIRRGEDLQYFRTPALGAGSNPGLTVNPASSLSLSNLFVIDPGFMKGSILLRGPSESLGRPSLLRGIDFAAQLDADADGIPDALGTYGIYYSSIGAEGTDTLAPGAQFTASYGYGYSGFKGAFNPDSSSFEGSYELALGGLLGEPGLWKRSTLTVTTSSEPGVPAADYYSSSFSITDTAAPEVLLAPTQTVVQDAAYCLSEVCITFRSTEPFFNPNIRFSHGGFTNVDFRGQAASYAVYLDPAYGTPSTPETAALTGQVILYLPEGSYELHPYVQPAGTVYGSVGGDPIEVTVGCGQRICIDRRLQLTLDLPTCAPDGSARVSGAVNSFGNTVTRVTWQLDDGEPNVVCEGCGLNPALDFVIPLPPGVHVLTVRAEDDTGGVSSITGNVGADTLAPTITCPADITLEANQPCGAILELAAGVQDNCDPAPTLVCTPALNSLFPIATTPVECVATDAAGNIARCSFTVTVNPGGRFTTPSLIRVTPNLVGMSGGGQLQVFGDGFVSSDEILIDGIELLYPVWVSPTEIDGQLPALSAGVHDVQVRRCGEIVARLGSACQSGGLPEIFSMDPPKAFASGGNSVIIRGTNFIATTEVRFGFPAPDGIANRLVDTAVSPDGTTITGRTPALPSGELFGPRDVTVSDARGQGVLPSGITYLPNELTTDPQVIAYRQFERESIVPAELRIRNGFPIALAGRVRVEADGAPDRAIRFLNRYRDLFRLANPAAELVAATVNEDEIQNVKLTQTYKGLEVIGAELSVLMSGEQVLDAVGGLLPTELMAGLNTEPAITGEEAASRARVLVGQPEAALHEPVKLAVFDRCLMQAAASRPYLVWTVALEGASAEVFIDAQTGEPVFLNAIEREHGGELEGFDLDLRDALNAFSPTNAPGCYGAPQIVAAGDENGMAVGYGNDNHATSARTHMQNAYRFLHSNFEWHSYNNSSSQLRVFVHSSVANASWSPSCSVISVRDGWVDYEILVHELTHGVVASTSKLRYFLQSGALDESYADVMAVLADRQAGDRNWTVGENRIGNAGSVRDIPNNAVRFWGQFNPGNGTETAANDFGNVHSNSGVPNYAAYLMATRSRLRGPTTILPLTEAKLLQLKFAAVRSLTTDATFMAARTREITLATEWAQNGKFGFSSDDVLIVRLSWADVGVGDELDADRDGIPDHDDNCVYRANPNQADADADGVGDVCDNCPNTFNSHQEDLDQDGIGDVCDDDMDGDGCRNAVDQHPTSSAARSGTFFSATCNPKTGVVYTFEGTDHDGDGRLDCEDNDDDGDGIPDDLDSCPLIFGSNANSCHELRDCPAIGKNWPFVCMFGGCNEFELRFKDRINPDPTRTIIFDKVQVVNETLYFSPGLGNTVQQASKAIVPKLAVGRLADLNESAWRVELWEKAQNGQPARLVAVVGEYDPGMVSLDQVTSGSMLAFTPGNDSRPPSLTSVWHTAADPSIPADLDTDHDGMPDGYERRQGLNPADPADAALDLDGDGINNLEEFLGGTDPRNPESQFRILRTSAVNHRYQIEFVGPAGRRFQLETASDIVHPQWTSVSQPVYGFGGITTIEHEAAGGVALGFYRLRLLPD